MDILQDNQILKKQFFNSIVYNTENVTVDAGIGQLKKNGSKRLKQSTVKYGIRG